MINFYNLPFFRHNGQKQKQIAQDVALMTSTCPNVKKLNLMLHHKMIVMDPECEFSDLSFFDFFNMNCIFLKPS